MKSLETKTPFLIKICKFIHAPHIFDEATIRQAKFVIADTVGSAFSGVQSSAFLTSKNNDVYVLEGGKYSIWGTEITTSLSGAVFYNSHSISSTDYDEGHRKAVGHPASQVVPVALLLGQHLEKSFSEVLKAVIIGYEVGTRFSHARVKEKINSYSTGRWGGIATAATAAYLLELTTEQTIHALSNAAVLSPAMLGGSTDVSTGSMSKEGVAWAAQAGLQSALMAKNGFSGPYLFVDETEDYQKQALIDGLGKEWLINSNYFKPYACCRWLHPAVKATLDLKEEIFISPFQIKKITVEVFSRALDLISSPHPENSVQAQFHLPFAIACVLYYSKVHPAHFNEFHFVQNIISPAIDKISLVANEEYSRAFPEKLQSKVIIELQDGRIFSKEMLEAPWDAGNHPSEQELLKKFTMQVNRDGWHIFDKIVHGNENLVFDIYKKEE
jgi:2-methylcitrate dehydratase PrpD